jgi:hypothetical protein
MNQSHVGHLLLFTALVSVFFAFLVRTEARARWRFGFSMAACMIVFSLALAWLMFPFPR